MTGPFDLMPLLYALAGYLALQVMLNLGLGLWLNRRGRRPVLMLQATFWSSVVNGLYFTVAAVLLHIYQLVPNRGLPPATGWWALGGLPLGVLLWYLTAQARRLGLALFGKGELIASEDAVLTFPPSPRYLGWGVANLTVIQPLGRELFMRGAFLPAVIATFGWGWALASLLVVELLLKLNVVWLLQTVLYTLFMCALFYFSGSALAGLIAAAVSGLLHAVALAYLGRKQLERSSRQRLEEAAAGIQEQDAAEEE